MRKYGLIGFPLEHSFSKSYFVKKFNKLQIKNVNYENYELDDINHLHNILTYLESTQISNTLPFWFSATDTTDHFYIDLQRSGHEEQYAERLKELTKMWDL